MRQCSECNGTGQVFDTREIGRTIVRRRRCRDCGHIWSSWETRYSPKAVRLNIAGAAERLHEVLRSTDEVFQQIRDEIDRLRVNYDREID